MSKTFNVEIIEDEGEVFWRLYLIDKYDFLNGNYFNNCKNKERCLKNNLHSCGCFAQYLANTRAMLLEELNEQ